MTNEERRAVANLMLMCYEHHTITHDVEKYPVPALRRLKAKHEAKFTAPEKMMLRAIADLTKAIPPSVPTSLKKMGRSLGWKITSEQRAARLEALSELIHNLRRVPIRTRQLLIVLIERTLYDSTVRHHEIREACDLDDHTVFEHVDTLKRYELVEADYQEAPDAEISVHGLWNREMDDSSGWAFWDELVEFCEKTGATLDDFVIELRFNLLD